MGGGSGGHDPFDIFQSFFGDDGSPFGGGGRSRGRRQKRRGCYPPSQGLFGGSLQWDIKEAFVISQCVVLKVQGYRVQVRCPQCKGEKVIQEKKVLEVHVEKGMQNGQKKEHPKFKRKGDDLFIEHTLTLTEALCGFQFVLTHLDNRQLLIKSQPGKFVKPDQFKAINDEGMLLYQRPFMRGKLYVHFTVDFPDSLKPEQCKNL
ncbi:DnaJ protein -like protein 2 [Capsicum chinense]|nr:DnaJ protein -like protein 2 [Capsicum chinense]